LNLTKGLIPPNTIYSYATDMWFDLIDTFFTNETQIRFRYQSDSNTQWKGWYIDDVLVNYFNGTAWNQLFFDDMEDEVSSMGNWTIYQNCYGNHWHVEDTFGNGPTAEWYWNGNSNIIPVQAKSLVNATYAYPSDFWEYTEISNGGFLYTGDGGGWFRLYAGGSATYDAYYNWTNVSLPVSPIIDLEFYSMTSAASD
jgi:hypothetical protein